LASVHTASCTHTVSRSTDHVGSKARGGGGCSPASTARRDSWPRQGCRHCHRGAPRTASRAPPPASRRAAASRPHHRLVRTVRPIPLAQPRARPIHVCDGNSGRPIPASMGGPPVQRLCRLPCRARHPHTLATGVVDSSSRRGRQPRRAASRDKAGEPPNYCCLAGRQHVLLAFPAPAAVSQSHSRLTSPALPQPPTRPWRLRICFQSSRDIFFFFFCSAERSRPSTGVRTVHGWYPLHACNYKLWLTPGHLGICAC